MAKFVSIAAEQAAEQAKGKAELERRQVPEDLSERVAILLERAEKGEVLADDDAEDVRQWKEDHPAVAQPTA